MAEKTENWLVMTGLSRGIGAQVGALLQREGFRLLHLGRKKSGFEDLFLEWDLLRPLERNPLGSLHAMLERKHVSGLFYAAGIIPLLPREKKNFAEKKEFWESQESAMRVNYFSCVELIDELMPFLTRPVGKSMPPWLAHLSSLAAVDPFPGFELYGSTKSALLRYFATMARHVSPKDLLYLALHPGTVKTDMVDELYQKNSGDMPVINLLKEADANGLMWTPEQSAAAIVQFILHNAQMREKAHGQLFVVDRNEILPC